MTSSLLYKEYVSVIWDYPSTYIFIIPCILDLHKLDNLFIRKFREKSGGGTDSPDPLQVPCYADYVNCIANEVSGFRRMYLCLGCHH